MPPLSLYLHIPFCKHRCAYCDFNTYAGMENLIEKYVQALQAELIYVGKNTPGNAGIHTIFFGGGTPTLVPANLLTEILVTIKENYTLLPDAEITTEANPGTLSLAYLTTLREGGFNRLSMGMQSANPQDLQILERNHDFFDNNNAVLWARQAGFENINLDLIFGLPYQTLESWQHTLELALGLNPEHFSLYNLILEHGTPMNAWVNRGLLPLPDGDLAADMYEYAIERLARGGYVQYEISNWAKPAMDGEPLVSRHNVQYWRNWPYLGLGAGAHGFANNVRTANVRGPQAYIERCLGVTSAKEYPRSPATINATPIDRPAAMGETMMMGLRLLQHGVSDEEFRERFAQGIADAFPEDVAELLRLELLEWAGKNLRLTERGQMLGNQVFMRFV